MKENITYECENCHKIFNTKAEALIHEQNSECEILEEIFVKEIYVDLNYPFIGGFIIHCYPNAKYKKSNDTIQLYQGGSFIPKDKFCFDVINVDRDEECLRDDIPFIFTMNNDPEHERKLINKLIDYKISDLNYKKDEIDEEIENWEKAKTTIKISRNDNTTWVNEKVLK